jgi:hypothetical protein
VVSYATISGIGSDGPNFTELELEEVVCTVIELPE